MNSDIHFEMNGRRRTAKWNHIETACNMDNFSSGVRLLQNITDDHLKPKGMKKMKVKLCAQILSHSVACGINVLIENGKKMFVMLYTLFIPQILFSARFSGPKNDLHLGLEAEDTSEFLSLWDRLFDSVNGGCQYTSPNPSKPLRSVVKTRDERTNNAHVEFWRSCLRTISTMYVIKDGRRKSIPCLVNWRRTLDNLILMRSTLRQWGVKEMAPRRLNQDPLENFFGKIRQRGVRFTNPTCSAFTPFYKAVLINSLSSKHSVGGNCEDDYANILYPLEIFLQEVLCFFFTISI